MTRKVTDGVARIKLGLADTLLLGNLDAQRDWGFAGDYVARDVADAAAGRAGRLRHRDRREPLGAGARRDRVRATSGSTGRSTSSWTRRFLRPAEVDHLIGDRGEGARRSSAGQPEVDFKQLVEMMVDADVKRLDAARDRVAPL